MCRIGASLKHIALAVLHALARRGYIFRQPMVKSIAYFDNNNFFYIVIVVRFDRLTVSRRRTRFVDQNAYAYG